MNNHGKGAGEFEGVLLTERMIRVPRSISLEAQAALAMKRERLGAYPDLADKAGWRVFVKESNESMAFMLGQGAANLPARAELQTIAGVPVYVGEPDFIPEKNRDKALVYFHGGALVLLGGECVSIFARMEAAFTRCKVYAVDYRNPPDYPYPAAIDDCVAVYRELLKRYQPAQLVLSGVSGGGNLAAAVPLNIRDIGLPLPAAVGLFTPEVDLTESGDTFETCRDIDVVLSGGLPVTNALYANGYDLNNPYVSPLFGDFTKGFPPTFVQTGTRDIFLSNSVRIHRALRRASIKAELHVWEAMPHGGFGGAPEDQEMRVEFQKFLAATADWAQPDWTQSPAGSSRSG